VYGSNSSHKEAQHHQQQKKAMTLSTWDVSHCGLAIYIKKYLKAKEELWKLK
jgi:hypothetical protein